MVAGTLLALSATVAAVVTVWRTCEVCLDAYIEASTLRLRDFRDVKRWESSAQLLPRQTPKRQSSNDTVVG